MKVISIINRIVAPLSFIIILTTTLTGCHLSHHRHGHYGHSRHHDHDYRHRNDNHHGHHRGPLQGGLKERHQGKHHSY